MAYFLVDKFGGGVDRRRSQVAAPGSTMWEINNAFVNKGGEIEKRKKWEDVAAVTASLTDANNRLNCHGPIPSFTRNGVFFIADTEPSGGSWGADGGGVALTSGSFQFGIYAAGAVPNGLQAVTAVVQYADEILLSAIEDPQTAVTPITQRLYAVTAGDICPTSDAAVAGRSATIPGTSTAEIDFVGRFLSSIGVSPNDFLLIKSTTGEPEQDVAPGEAEIEVRGQGTEIGRPFAIEHYYDQVAVFGENGIQFWNISATGSSFAYSRGIAGEALLGQRTPLPYADGDVLYLTENGIRSLQARDSSNLAQVSDIGSPIDQLVTDALSVSLGLGNVAVSVVHQQLGQAWFFVSDKVYVLSRYPSADVLAWSTFDLPPADPELSELSLIVGGLTVSDVDFNPLVIDACRVSSTVCVRTGTDEVFVYGGLSLLDGEYDDSTATVVTPYFTMQDPFGEKTFEAFDITCTGTWEIEYSLDIENEAWVSIGSVTGNSHLQGDIRLDVTSNMIALRLTTSSESKATLSQFAIHYKQTQVKG